MSYLGSASQSPTKSKEWWVYMVLTARCNLYTGITTNVKTRIDAHNAGRGAKCLRGQLPVHFLFCGGPYNHSEALVREAQIKKMKRAEKVALLHRMDCIEK